MTAEPPSLIEMITLLAREWGRDDVAEALERSRTLSADAVATVVVVGEMKRGKSRFVNALVGARVCPVDADVASNTFVTIGFGSPSRARVVTAERPEGIAVALEEVSVWASEQGNPGNRSAVQRVDVLLDSSLLAEGLRVIDTPGVGGLDAAHREISLATLRWADALLFVLDPDAPFSRPEYEFLCAAAERIGSVFFVLTKRDLYLDWETIAADDLRLIDLHAPRFQDAPLLAVSSLDKEEADLEHDEDLLERSGFAAVETLLRERVVGRAANLRVWNLARAALTAIEALEAPEQITLSADTTTDIGAAVEAARAALAAHGDRTRTWTAPLFIEHQRRVANPLQLYLRRRIRELSEAYDRQIAKGSLDPEALPAEMDAQLRALALDARDEVVQATARLLEHFADTYQLELPELPAVGLAKAAEPLDLPSLAGTAHEPPTTDVARRLMAAGSVSRSALYGRSLAAAMGPVGLAVGVAIGGLALVGGQFSQRRSQDVQAARALVARALETARLEIDADLRARLLDAQQFVQDELRRLIDQRTRALKEELSRLEKAAQQNTSERETAGNAARQRLERTAPLRAMAEAMCQRTEELNLPSALVDVSPSGGRPSSNPMTPRTVPDDDVRDREQRDLGGRLCA